MEEWRNVKDYEGLYKVSNLGRVYSVRRGTVMKQTLHSTGYRVVSLHKDMKTVVCYVHRLVANAFLPKEEGYYEINHKDEDKSNNAVDNLEWCTRVYNLNYGTAKYRKVINNKKRRAVRCVETGKEYISVNSASRATGAWAQNISHCLNGKQKSTGTNKETGEKLHWVEIN